MTKTPIAAALAALALVATAATAQAEISAPARAAVLRALDDEYHAEATYAAIIAKFGPVKPFSNIVGAEEQHSSKLIGILKENDLPVPANPYTTGEKALEPVPATVAEACEAGVAAEIANMKLYDDELLPEVAGYPQVSRVMTSLRDASQTKHLPAFTRCAGK